MITKDSACRGFYNLLNYWEPTGTSGEGKAVCFPVVPSRLAQQHCQAHSGVPLLVTPRRASLLPALGDISDLGAIKDDHFTNEESEGVQ